MFVYTSIFLWTLKRNRRNFVYDDSPYNLHCMLQVDKTLNIYSFNNFIRIRLLFTKPSASLCGQDGKNDLIGLVLKG